jgi:hypothetical protein
MATQSETHTNINMLIHMMQARGARRTFGGNYRLTWQHNSIGYLLVWEERTTGGVSVIARLGETKPQVIKTCRAMMDILQTIERTN